MKILQNFRINLAFPFVSYKLSPPPHMPPKYESGTYNGSKSKWHMACVFLFYVKIFMQSTFIYTINLLKPYMFLSSNDIGCSVGLRHPIKSILEPEGNLNYFDKFMVLLTQNSIFEITSMS